jgi:hypothetical protein
VKSLIRLLGVVVFSVAALSLMGCGTDNESEAGKSAALGNPGEVNPKSLPSEAPSAPEASYEDLAKRAKDPSKNMLKQGYPKN